MRYVSRGSIQYRIRRLIVWSRKVSKVRDWVLKCLYHFEIWQAPRQQWCLDPWQIGLMPSVGKSLPQPFEINHERTKASPETSSGKSQGKVMGSFLSILFVQVRVSGNEEDITHVTSSVIGWNRCHVTWDLVLFVITSLSPPWHIFHRHSTGTIKIVFITTSLAPLTHWGRVTHICVGKLTIIGLDNGLSPERRQAIIWTNAGILLIRTLATNFSEILSEIHTFSFKKMHLKISSAKWRPFCLRLNVLKSIWSWFHRHDHDLILTSMPSTWYFSRLYHWNLVSRMRATMSGNKTNVMIICHGRPARYCPFVRGI